MALDSVLFDDGATGMSGSDKYIKKRKGRTTLYYQRAVPKAMQGKYGKVIQESLGTSDLRAARHKRDELTVEWNRTFAAGEQQTKRTDIRSKATQVAKLFHVGDGFEGLHGGAPIVGTKKPAEVAGRG